MDAKQSKCWFALFSQTGSELKSLCEKLGRWPNFVITNSKSVNVDEWKEKTDLIHIEGESKITDNTYFKLFELAGTNDIVVTLHGWLKIIPPTVCKRYVIFNGHPGDIETYPELKGKDPQRKAFELELPTSGCIIHRVTEEVDGGPVIDSTKVTISHCKTIDDVVITLKKVSLEQWKNLLDQLL